MRQENLLKAAVFTPLANGRWGLPLVLEGPPGAAKSSIIYQFARRIGLPARCLSPSFQGSGAFGVVPMPVESKSGYSMIYPPPEWVEEFDGGGIIFVDEITSAGPELQAPVLALTLDRRLGNHEFGPRVRVVGACNPAAQGANVHDLAPSLANRLGWIKWTAPSAEDSIQYMMNPEAAQEGGTPLNAKSEEARVLLAWDEAYAEAVGLWAAFISSHSNFLNKCPPEGDPRGSKGWPSNRSWEHAIRAWASAQVHNLTDKERDELVSAFVGAEATEAFAVASEYKDLPSSAALLDGKASFTPDPSRLDKTAVVLTSACTLVVNESCTNREARAVALWGLLRKVTATAADLVVPVVQELAKAHLHALPSTVEVAEPVLAALRPALKAAGFKAR